MDGHPIISCTGLTHFGLYLPSFSLKSGEILLIDLRSGGHHHRVLQWLVQRLSGDIPMDGVQVFQRLVFVPHFEETAWRKMLFPIRVGRFLRKYSNSSHPLSQRIYDGIAVSAKTPFKSLSMPQRRILELSAAMSLHPAILFDLNGMGPEPAQVVFDWVNAWVKEGGTAILLDWSSEFSDCCDASIQVEYDSLQSWPINGDQ